MKRIIIVVLALAVVLGFLFWKFAPNFFEKKPEVAKEITLNISALWEEENLIKPALEAYHKDHPNVTLNYKYQSSTNYRSRVQAQIDDPNEGIDIFLIHNTWLPIFLKNQQLSAMPEGVMTFDEFDKTFYPIVKETLTANNRIYAIPRGIDGLVLYYNEDILKAAGEVVPQTWDQFIDSSRKLTVKDTNGAIKTAGAAMGTTGNVDHWSDIIGLLFLQNPGSKLEAPNDAAGAEVIKFYTNFVTDVQNRVWDPSFEHSTDAFASGKVAFYFGPSWRASELRVKNPQLNFKTAPVPQIPGSERNVGWGTFWAYAVSSKSGNQTAAWEFLKYLTSADVERLLYQEAAKVRLMGLPYSRLDMQADLVNDLLVGPFVTQAPIYKSWYLSSETHDAALNDQIIKYYEDAVNATVNGGDPLSVLETTQQGVEEVLSEYNPTPIPAPTQ
jgi:multiple sugar transport system substrate-binding protein